MQNIVLLNDLHGV